MKFIYMLIATIVIYGVYMLVRLCVCIFKLRRLQRALDNLTLDFKIYNKRKKFLNDNNLSYETEFAFECDEDDCTLESEGSQKEFMELLYAEISLIDLYIEEIPEQVIEDEAQLFYELRRKIRTEKLACESTTF